MNALYGERVNFMEKKLTLFIYTLAIIVLFFSFVIIIKNRVANETGKIVLLKEESYSQSTTPNNKASQKKGFDVFKPKSRSIIDEGMLKKPIEFSEKIDQEQQIDI